jgi:hypothetical protein
MLFRVSIILILLRVAMFAADQPTEAQLIGTWNVSFLGSVTRITLRPDHTCTIWRRSADETRSEIGAWQLKGDHLKVGASEVLIQSITDDQLEVTIPEDTWAVWTRVK